MVTPRSAGGSETVRVLAAEVNAVRTTAGDSAFLMNLRGSPLPSAGTVHKSGATSYSTR